MKPSIHVDVSPFVHGLIWIGIACAYGICATFLAFQAAIYFYIPAKAPRLMSDLELYSIGVDRRHYATIGSVCIAIAVLQVASLFQTLYSSFRQHKRHHKVRDHPPARIVDVVQSFHRVMASMEVILPPRSLWRRRVLGFIGASTVSIWRALDVTNPNYGVVYVTREIVQTVIQTYQAYRLSSFVAQAWMNRIVVILLVLNCWASPIIKVTMRSSVGATRVMCLMVNVVLDFVAFIVFPVTLFLPYYADFDPVLGDFPVKLWYTDVWLVQVLNEWQMLVIASIWDATSKVFIVLDTTRALRAIPCLVRLRSPLSGSSASGPQSPLAQTVRSAWKASEVPSSRRSADSIVKTTEMVTTGPRQKWRHRVEHVGHIILALWGLGVLTAHVQSEMTGDNNRCLVQVRPWLTTRPVCSLMEINCYGSQLRGDAKDFDHAIETIQREWLAYLIVRHCDAVEITPRIHDLPWLMALKVYNSTLIRWDQDAALTQTHNPRMLFVFMVVIKAQAVPPGLYARDFPPKLYDIELSDWNVTSLPDAIVDVWHSGMFLVVEKFQFSAFPDALTKLRPNFLSVACNNFTDIPKEMWENDELIAINVNNNPITSLPLEPWTSQLIVQFHIVETLVTELPSWIDANTVVQVQAGNTPLCSALEANGGPTESNSSLTAAVVGEIIDCTPAGQYSDLTSYPLNDELTSVLAPSETL